MDRAFYAGPESGTYERRRRGESFLRERHRLFLRRASPGRLLDVGCGEGAFLEVARARGFAVAGLDLDPGNVAAAHARGLTDVACSLLLDEHGALPAQLRGAPPFQWVTAFEVLEHQADPLAFLAAARGLLAPGGALCGSVPNRERALAARDRQRSDGDYPPHHFLWFSPPDLTAMLRRAGFSRVEVAPIREVDAQSYASFLESSLLGGVTSRAKRVARGAGAPPASGGAGGGPTSLRARAIRAARWAKNVPFLPLAVGLRWLAPARARGLYFEARLSG
jgi:SAM-dependent methyltransferase